MPIHVSIAVNERTVDVLHIARVRGEGRNPDATHTYSVLNQPNLPLLEGEWGGGLMFEHRYGDGVRALVSRALQVLGEESQTTASKTG